MEETRVYRVSWETDMGLFNNDGMYVGLTGRFNADNDYTGWNAGLDEVDGFTVAHVVADIAQAALGIDPDDDIGLGRYGIRQIDRHALKQDDKVVFCKSGHEPQTPEDVEVRLVQIDNVHDEHWDTSFVPESECEDPYIEGLKACRAISGSIGPDPREEEMVLTRSEET